NCAEAMTFYQQCLGGELTLTKLGDTPMKGQFPPEKHNRIINAHLKSGALEFSATDWMASPALEPKLGNTFAIFVVGGTYDELKAVFDKLAEGASKEWFRNSMTCHLEHTDSFLINMEFSGFSRERKKSKESVK